jgi:AcrR family transcriptional regulator
VREQEILDAATSLFAEHGYANTDTQLLADRLGVGKGTLYRYFASKQELFLAAVDRGMRRLCEHIDASMADLEDPVQRIKQVVRSYLDFFVRQPELVEFFIQERAQFRNRKKPAYFEYRETNRERFRAMYRSYIEAGQIREMPVDRILNVLGDLLYGTMITNYFSGRQASLETQAEDILDVVFHGILSDEARRRQTPQREENRDA